MILASGRFDIPDVVTALMELPEEQAQVSAPALATAVATPQQEIASVIIWAGTQLSDFYIGKLHAVYVTLSEGTRHGDTKQLSETLYQRIVLEADPAENKIRKDALGHACEIEQALDQELIHAEAVVCTGKILGNFGPVAVHRPPDASFIRPDLQNFPPDWSIYNTGPVGSGPLLTPGLDASKAKGWGTSTPSMSCVSRSSAIQRKLS